MAIFPRNDIFFGTPCTVSASEEESIAQYIKDVPREHFNEANYTQTVTFKLLISGVSVMPPALFVTSSIPDKKYLLISEKYIKH